MPKIMKTSEQEKALQTIVADLKIVDRINTVMENVEILDAGTVTVQADSAKVSLSLSSSVVNKLLGDVRKEKVSEVKTLAKRYTITLDDEDKKIIAAGSKNAKAAPAPVAPAVAEPVEPDVEGPDEEDAEADTTAEDGTDTTGYYAE